MTMLRTLLLFSMIAASCRAEDGAFTPLFDGESLAGWVQRGGDAVYEVDADAEGGPQIVGTSVAGTPNSFLCTDRDYGDFVLEFEVWVDPSLNSGVQFRSNAYEDATTATLTNAAGEPYEKQMPAGRVHGYQCEIDPSDRAWSGGVYDEARRGWLSKPEGDDEAAVAARGAFDADGWNHYRVEATGDSIRTFLNGVPVTDLRDDVTATGFIGLQVHSIGSPEQAGKQVRWRNLRIKAL